MGSPYSREYGDPGVPIFTGCVYFYDNGPEAVSESVRCYHVALSKYDSYSTYD